MNPTPPDFRPPRTLSPAATVLVWLLAVLYGLATVHYGAVMLAHDLAHEFAAVNGAADAWSLPVEHDPHDHVHPPGAGHGDGGHRHAGPLMLAMASADGESDAVPAVTIDYRLLALHLSAPPQLVVTRDRGAPPTYHTETEGLIAQSAPGPVTPPPRSARRHIVDVHSPIMRIPARSHS